MVTSQVVQTQLVPTTQHELEFQINPSELAALFELRKQFFSYALIKYVLAKTSKVTLQFHQYFCTTSSICSSEEKSHIVYLDILNMHADCRDTMLSVVELLQTKYKVVGESLPGLPVAGDTKTFNHLHSLKKEHSEDLHWLLPMPGDWHTLKNFHPVFMLAYGDAGLKQLAEAAGFRSATLTALLGCQNFHITHNFIMQPAEALMREMIRGFMETKPSDKSEQLATQLVQVHVSDQVFETSICQTSLEG